MKKLGNKGITLVALVVTIIVLIILAGVSISLVLGQGGLVEKAKQGRDNYAETARLENEQLANVDAFAKDIGNIIPSTLTGKINNEIDAKIEEPARLSESEIKNAMSNSAESLATLYGMPVDTSFFTSNEGEDWIWQIFYDDTTNIYLIASDYVPNSKLPAYGNAGYTTTTDGVLKKSESTTNKYSTYCALFSSSTNGSYVLADGTIYKAGSASTALTNNTLTNIYLRWVGLNQNGKNTNIQCTAFMMDTNKWSSFVGSKYENAFAIGGPTLEMFTKSWNAYPEHTSNQLGSYDTLTNNTNYTSLGYKVWNIASSQWKEKGTTGDLGNNTNMWYISEKDKASGYYIASPTIGHVASSGSSNYYGIASADYQGKLAYAYYGWESYGFRPIVCIPKSKV